MARARGRRPARRTRFMRADWVYRPSENIEGAFLGSYTGGQAHTLATGPSGVAAAILYDSVDYKAWLTLNGLAQAAEMPSAARAEGRTPTVLAMEAWVRFRSTNWIAGAYMMGAVRLGLFEQDTISSQLSLQAEYTIWDVADGNAPAIFANDRQTNMKTWYFAKGIGDGSASNNLPMHLYWKGRRRFPSSKHCLALYFETPAIFNTADLRFEIMARSLISDEG